MGLLECRVLSYIYFGEGRNNTIRVVFEKVFTINQGQDSSRKLQEANQRMTNTSKQHSEENERILQHLK